MRTPRPESSHTYTPSRSTNTVDDGGAEATPRVSASCSFGIVARSISPLTLTTARPATVDARVISSTTGDVTAGELWRLEQHRRSTSHLHIRQQCADQRDVGRADRGDRDGDELA